MLAMDLGASNGRGIVGSFDGDKLGMRELHRFANDIIDLNGFSYFDSMRLYSDTVESLRKCAREGFALSSVAIDTWGVDYGLLDKSGQLLGNTLSYRMATEEDMQNTWKIVSRRELFNRTGLAHMNFNTIYQLHARKLRDDPALAHADKMLQMPDLLAYFLSGDASSEYTIATTSMLYNPYVKDWDYDIIERLGLPRRIFQPIIPSGTVRGKLLASVANETGCKDVSVVAVGGHDTASAVAAIPGKGDFAFLSSGTWSLFGVETDEPVFSDLVFDAQYSNEGTVQGGFRTLKNIIGLWLIQECRRDWQKKEGGNVPWDEIVAQAKAAKPFRSIIDTDSGEFYAAGNMEGKIRDYCRRTNQPVPETKGEIARCIYESLALKYRWALERLEEIKSKPIDALHIVGGGIQNKLLNQFVANAIGRTVVTGPVEGACIGNLLMQAKALGEIDSLDQIREVVRRSFEVEEYYPQDKTAWEDAYGRLLGYLNQ